MSLGQSAANRLNQKYSQEEEDSFLQSYFKKNPLAKMGAMMSRLGAQLVPLIPGAGMLAAPAMLGAMGLSSTATKQKENKRLTDFKAAEGFHNSNAGGGNFIADPFRSLSNAVGSVSNPLMMSSIGATLAGMPGLGGAMMTGSMATRSPMMGLQAASGMGLTNFLSDGAANKTIEGIASKGMEGAAGSIQLGSSLLPSTLMYGAGSALSGAGSLAGMLGAGGVGEALTKGGGLMDSGAGGLLDLISSSMGTGPMGMGSLLGPGLGMLATMALQKPVGKMMNWAHDKASGTQAQNQGGSIRPRLLSSSQLIKRYSMTSQLDNQVRSLGAQGQLDTYQWMVLSYLGAIEKPLSLLGYLSEEANKKAESDRVGGNQIQNSFQDKLNLTGDSENDLTKVHVDQDKTGALDYFRKDASGDRLLSGTEFFQDPGRYIKQSLASGFLDLEKTALQTSAIMNPAGWLLGGKHSVGSKLKDIRDKDNQGKVAGEISKLTGIPIGGVTIMETTAINLASGGKTIDEKKMAIMGGTYELIRLSTFFLQDIRTALGVTKETSMLGKMDASQKLVEERSDKRSNNRRTIQDTLDAVDKIPILSVIGSLFGEGLRGWDDLTGLVKDQNPFAAQASKDAFIDVTPINYQEETVDLLDMIHRMLYFQLDNIGSTAEAIRVNTLDTADLLDYISECPCDGKPGMAFGGVFTEGVVPGSKQPKGHDNVLMRNVSLQSEEFVVNADASKDNRDLLHAINDNTKPRVLESIDNNIYKIVTSLTKEVGSNADTTDAALEAEQAKDAKTIREISLVESVTNIEELLEKCCGSGMMGGNVRGKKERKERKDSFGSGVAESVIGSAVAATISGGKFGAKLAGLGAILAMTGMTENIVNLAGMDAKGTERVSKMIEYGLMGSTFGIKGAAVGAIAGWVSVAGKQIVNSLFDEKESPTLNAMGQAGMAAISGGLAGYAYTKSIKGAMIGAVVGTAIHFAGDIFDFITDEKTTEVMGKMAPYVGNMIGYGLIGAKVGGAKGAVVGALIGYTLELNEDIADAMFGKEESPVMNTMTKGMLGLIEGAMLGFYYTKTPMGAFAGAVAGLLWSVKDELIDFAFGSTPEEKLQQAKEEKEEKRVDKLNLVLDTNEDMAEKFAEDSKHKNNFSWSMFGVGDPVDGAKWTVDPTTDKLLFTDRKGITWDVKKNKVLAGSVGEASKTILSKPLESLDVESDQKKENSTMNDENLEILAKNKSSKMILSKPININSEPKKERQFFPDNIIPNSSPNSSPTVKVETVEEIKKKTSIPVIESEKQQAKQKKQKEEELKINKEEKEKTIALTEDTNSHLILLSNQISVMSETMILIAQNESDNANGLGTAMTHTVKELQKLNSSNWTIASQGQQNKNAIIQKA